MARHFRAMLEDSRGKQIRIVSPEFMPPSTLPAGRLSLLLI